MASIKMLKPGLYPVSSSPSCSRRNERFGCSNRMMIVEFSSKLSTKRTVKVSCRFQDADNNEGNGKESLESLFMKELRRRGMTPSSLLDESLTTSNNEEIMFKEEDGTISNTVSKDLDTSLCKQRERSKALNSEGLEGFIPLASLLLRLGGTFFLAFWPLILLSIACFSAIDLYFGPKFDHDGTLRQVQLP